MIKYFDLLILLSIFQINIFGQINTKTSLVGFEYSGCLEEFHVYKLNNRIVKSEKYFDTTMIEISVRANCCINLIPNIIVNGDTIDLDFDYYEPIVQPDNGDTIVIIRPECKCDCCFNFRYYLTGIKDDNSVYRVNNSIIEKTTHKYKIVKEATFELNNGDTINFIDAFGFKQGLHRFADSAKQIISEIYYRDDDFCHGLFWRNLQMNGTLLTEWYYLDNGKYKKIEYYDDGSFKKECLSEFMLDDRENCREYKKGEKVTE